MFFLTSIVILNNFRVDRVMFGYYFDWKAYIHTLTESSQKKIDTTIFDYLTTNYEYNNNESIKKEPHKAIKLFIVSFL